MLAGSSARFILIDCFSRLQIRSVGPRRILLLCKSILMPCKYSLNANERRIKNRCCKMRFGRQVLRVVVVVVAIDSALIVVIIGNICKYACITANYLKANQINCINTNLNSMQITSDSFDKFRSTAITSSSFSFIS